MDANQAKEDANLKTMLASMDAHQTRMDAMHKKLMAKMDAWLTDTNDNREKTMACQEKTEVHLKGKEEPASVEIKPGVAHEEVPLEDAPRIPVREPRKRRRDRNLDARRRRKQNERTQNKDGCRKSLVTADRRTTRRTKVAWRKRSILRKSWTQRNCGLRKEATAAGIKVTRRAGVARRKRNFVRKYPTRDIVEQEIPKRRAEENKRWKGPEYENDIRDRGLKQQLRGNKQTKNPTTNDIERWNPGERAPLRSGGTRKKDICDIFREKIMEHVVGTSSGLRRRKNWTLWRGRPLRTVKKNNVRARRAGCGGAPATPEVMALTGEKVTVRTTEREKVKKKETTVDDVENLDLLAP
jgi:hypothetical protein